MSGTAEVVLAGAVMLLETITQYTEGLLRSRPSKYVRLARNLTLLAALVVGAVVVLANGSVSIVNQVVVFRAVEAGADLVAAL